LEAKKSDLQTEELQNFNRVVNSHRSRNIVYGQWKKFMYCINFISFFASVAFLTIMSLDRFFLIVGSPALFSRPRELFQKYTNLICLLAWMFSIFWCIPLFIWYTVNPRTSQVSLQLDGQIKSTNWSSWDIPQANKLDIGELCGVHLGSSINSFLQSSFFKENCGESIVEHLKFEKCEKLQCEIVENFNIGKNYSCWKNL